ncbi:MAG: family 10 glycosylhydrolase, partial [Thermotogaceae bacterium]|nr:family 10 glycosylhydrolase [Thermotogaceae bacterium]
MVELRAKIILLMALIIAVTSFGVVGVWIVRDMITSPTSIDEIVDTAIELGLDRLYVQVVGRADAFYKSDILPRSHLLKDSPNNFDPLGYILEKTRNTGIKISAWMNVFYAWPFGNKPESPNHAINKHPEWVTYDAKGYSMFNYEKAPDVNVPGIFLDPGIDDVKEFVASIAEEIARKYDVGEIHLDYIRYPYRTFGYNPSVMKKFRKWTRQALKEGKIKSFAEVSFDDFRREQVNQTVKLIKEKVEKYGKKLSAAVFPYYPEAHDDRLQDWPTWIKKGYIDYVVL